MNSLYETTPSNCIIFAGITIEFGMKPIAIQLLVCVPLLKASDFIKIKEYIYVCYLNHWVKYLLKGTHAITRHVDMIFLFFINYT